MQLIPMTIEGLVILTLIAFIAGVLIGVRVSRPWY